MTESEQLPPAPQSRVDAQRDCSARKAFDDVILTINNRLAFVEEVPAWKIDTEADKAFRRIAAAELRFILSQAQNYAIWYDLPNIKFSRAADESRPATATPPALAETPCSAVSEGGRS